MAKAVRCHIPLADLASETGFWVEERAARLIFRTAGNSQME